jgi:hypothetical protein
MTARRGITKGIVLILAVIFFGLSWNGIQKGKEGPWHLRCVEFWEKHDWAALKTLAQNLETAGKSDFETYYFAMLAANQNRDQVAVKELGKKLLETRSLNFEIERNTASVLKAESPLESVRLFRTRAVMSIWIVLAALQLLYLIRKNVRPLWMIPFSVAGIALLFV